MVKQEVLQFQDLHPFHPFLRSLGGQRALKNNSLSLLIWKTIVLRMPSCLGAQLRIASSMCGAFKTICKSLRQGSIRVPFVSLSLKHPDLGNDNGCRCELMFC
ncbi:hypothetical protein CEXT_275601 [Caerostris extrusa]|uniref:Uncharacterized protein n=1 Tax=Caerostris extrusa TaxID=172846 RepID=A0AAV4PDL1_CAEEX|nr:hypothetical protein CEXT_275601 [Caerostris extrusa]